MYVITHHHDYDEVLLRTDEIYLGFQSIGPRRTSLIS